MTVIHTDKWLLELYDEPIEICGKIEKFFDGVAALDIFQYLTMNGMYRQPDKEREKVVQELHRLNVWEFVKQEERNLMKLWNGPNVPIFILPADTRNRQMNVEYNGKSGLAFDDKLFLFISGENTKNEIRALFTHEYNHVCRLTKNKKKEKDYVLLDSVILEGLAENAVREQFSKKYTAAWTLYYTEEELVTMWERIILPNKDLPKLHRKHPEYLFGLKFQPKMVGYCVGYYLVSKFMLENNLTSKEILHLSSERIAQVNK
ncbi:Uncharacterized protein YjaZ [Oceanobacillus limi]|uniref:Uncharacterized protein YjaZ n=1 Tax=Oceanobacillus limi TaxID=930131 RepID=A0A1I0GBQ2_9BACI|nr:DUF2268 domain-containing protein [Oceanobacillus limi]SET67619.1 Uncharacterized protein YjaZ [Oceanobacillus limi]